MFSILSASLICFEISGQSSRSTSYAKKALNQHNSYRSSHGSSPLSLDNRLSSGAEQWAKLLASKGTLQHSNGQGQYGENLSMRCGDDDAVKSW